MRKRLFAIAICLLVPSAISAQTKRPMTYDDIMALKTVGGTAMMMLLRKKAQRESSAGSRIGINITT